MFREELFRFKEKQIKFRQKGDLFDFSVDLHNRSVGSDWRSTQLISMISHSLATISSLCRHHRRLLEDSMDGDGDRTRFIEGLGSGAWCVGSSKAEGRLRRVRGGKKESER
ncbi:hypothetical protein U1Q18_005153 [Sarracenia purpurea var. burkii]